MDEQDMEYKKGFNHAYALKENGRQLFYDTVLKGLQGDSPYREGLVDGGKQYDKDINREMLRKRLGKDNEANRQNEHDR